VSSLRIADHSITDEERADLLLLLGADPQDDPIRSNTCDCHCDCYATSIGGGICRQCMAGDHLWPEAGAPQW
jgi:hypothetical protein